MASSPSDENTLLNQESLYLSSERWFKLLQDAGKEMSAAEVKVCSEQPKKRWTRKVAHANYFYSQLYNLASEVYDRLQNDSSFFPNLGKNKTGTIHSIGKLIANRRILKSRADLHSLPAGEEGDTVQCTHMPEYAGQNQFYFLSQREVLLFCHQKFGNSRLEMTKNFTLDDKVRVAGICFCEAGVREYLSDMLGKSKGGDRGAIDAARGRKSAGFLLLHQNFTDPEVVVPIPEEWEREETRNEIDRLRGAGTFDEHGQFDPNNRIRIALPWSPTEVEVIFKTLTLEYNKAMKLYTMGTGGGPGAPENFNVWQERDPATVVSYIQQSSFIYLSLVHIWDKKYSFPFVDVKDSLPTNAAIGDGWTPQEDGSEFGDGESCQTPKVSRAGLRMENNLLKVLGKMSAARESSVSTSERLLAMLENDKKSHSHESLVDEIAKTTKLKDEYSAKIDSLRAMKRNILDGQGGEKSKKKSKIASLLKTIGEHKKMVKTLDKTVTSQRKKLEEMSKEEGGEDIDVSSESGASAFSSDAEDGDSGS